MIAWKRTWSLTGVQMLVAGCYFYGVAAYLTTDARYFPEQAPPAWALPAVYSTLFGLIFVVPCLLVAAPLLKSGDYRAENRLWPMLALATGLGLATVVTMASPLGWEIFDWYVS
jgi:hypothetical protein